MQQTIAKGNCPNCGHDWTAHSDFIGKQEKVCEEVLPNGYRLRIHYGAENKLWFAQVYEGDLFVCQHYGKRAISMCKASITRRLNADRKPLSLPPIHTPKGFLDDDTEDW